MFALKKTLLCAPFLVGTLFLSAGTCFAEGIDSTTNTDLPIGAGGQRAMTICGGGEDCAGAKGGVLIGTTGRAPQATLDVEGTILASGAVRPGNATMGASCQSMKDGALAYDAEKNTPIYCKEGTWTGLDSGYETCGLTWYGMKAVNHAHTTLCTPYFNIPCKGHDIVTEGYVAASYSCAPSCPTGYLVLSHTYAGASGSSTCVKKCPNTGDAAYGFRVVYGTCKLFKK